MKSSTLLKTLLILFLTVYGCPVLAQEQNRDSTVISDGINNKIRSNTLKIDAGFGASLVRNDIAPTFHIHIGMKHRERYEGNFNVSSMFFFQQGDGGKYNVYRNSFLNAEFMLNLNPMMTSTSNWNGLGVGYLMEARGRYFSETTMQLYYRKKFSYYSVMPALIFDDNFKDVWPMITIRIG